MTSPANGTSALSTFVTLAATHSATNVSLTAAIFITLDTALALSWGLKKTASAQGAPRENTGTRIVLVLSLRSCATVYTWRVTSGVKTHSPQFSHTVAGTSSMTTRCSPRRRAKVTLRLLGL